MRSGGKIFDEPEKKLASSHIASSQVQIACNEDSSQHANLAIVF